MTSRTGLVKTVDLVWDKGPLIVAYLNCFYCRFLNKNKKGLLEV